MAVVGSILAVATRGDLQITYKLQDAQPFKVDMMVSKRIPFILTYMIAMFTVTSLWSVTTVAIDLV